MFIQLDQAIAQETGTITGKVVDATTGDELVGATVMIKDNKLGSVAKIDGSFRIANVPVGEYTLTVNYIGYTKVEIKGVKVTPAEVNKLNVSLQPEDVMTDEVVVTARALKTTGAALLKDRQKAGAMSDAIGAEEISRTGGGDAADAIKKVTGATTVGGKYVYIRGLGGRYSSTQLNGANLPSADPDKKAVHLDMFPSDLIENIKTIKTATPDKPGDFTGGTVDINTKSFPEQFKFGLSMSSSYNTNTTGRTILTHNSSPTDFLGYDNGEREVPDLIQQRFNVPKMIKQDGKLVENPDYGIPEITQARSKNNTDKALLLDELSTAFDREFAPHNMSAPLNTGFSINAGDNLWENKLGYMEIGRAHV